MKPIQSNDVVRILHPQLKGRTGVVNRRDQVTDMINVFITGSPSPHIGIWFFNRDLKRIGAVKRRG